MAKVFHGDCLEVMKGLPDSSVDMILTDLPYGTTSCDWDSEIDLEKLWEQYKRLIKGNGAIVLFCQQPFTSKLITSNLEMFKYMWYWRKSRPSGFVNAKLKPLKDVEEIAVFSRGATANSSLRNMPFYPQGLVEVNRKWKRPRTYGTGKGVNPTRQSFQVERVIKYEGYPRQVLDYSNHNSGQLHEAEKPVAILEYLIKTYSLEGNLVLDSTAGSGSLAEACLNTGRDFICIEKEERYYKIIKQRISRHAALYDLI